VNKLVPLVFASACGLLAQSPTILSVVNTESPTQSTALSPGLLATIYGTGFGSSTTAVSVLVGGTKAYVYYVGPTQINLQIPFNAPLGPGTVTVLLTSGGTSTPFDITLVAETPTLGVTPNTTIGEFVDPNGKYISNSNVATAGEVLTLYPVGLGPTNPAINVGPPPKPGYPTVTLPTVTVGGVDATVSFSGLSAYAGLYQVNFTVPANLQGIQPVVISIDGQSSNSVNLPLLGIAAVTSAASSSANPGIVAPGEIVSVYAYGMGSKDETTTGYQTTSAEGVSVTFNGIAAPIIALVTESFQLNVIVPSELPTTGTVQAQVTTSTGMAPDETITMSAAVPGIFLTNDPSNAKADIAAAQFANTVWIVVPASTATALKIAQNCTVSNESPTTACGQPAAPGDYIVLYVTGLGEVTPNGNPSGTPLATGVTAPSDGSVLYETVATPTIMIGGIAATPLFSGVAPGFAGLYQIDLQVPSGVSNGDAVPITVSMPGSTTASATIAIQAR
jgi:uncharacterized protein (TIGR03437 family)